MRPVDFHSPRRSSQQRWRRPNHHRAGVRHGYVLITTLLLLVLASTLLVGIGRASVRQAVRARAAQDELQRRWGTASCREAVLPYAEGLLRAEEGRSRRPVPSLRRRVTLGGQAFDLVIADEQAKANVNVLLVEFGREGAEDAIRRYANAIAPMNALRLRPARQPMVIGERPVNSASQDARRVEQWMTGYGQVFDGVSPASLLKWESRQVMPAGPAAALSCWGDGAINVRRAPEPLLSMVIGARLSAIDIGRLVAARDASFEPPLLATGSGGDRRPTVGSELARLRPLIAAARLKAGSPGAAALVDGSSCHSLWVAAADGRRKWYTFFVLDRADSNVPLRQSFTW